MRRQHQLSSNRSGCPSVCWSVHVHVCVCVCVQRRSQKLQTMLLDKDRAVAAKGTAPPPSPTATSFSTIAPKLYQFKNQTPNPHLDPKNVCVRHALAFTDAQIRKLLSGAVSADMLKKPGSRARRRQLAEGNSDRW